MGAAGGDGGGEVGGDESNLRDMADLTRLKVGEAASLQKCPEVDETEPLRFKILTNFSSSFASASLASACTVLARHPPLAAAASSSGSPSQTQRSSHAPDS